MITPCNTEALSSTVALSRSCSVNSYGDKGYLSQALFQKLFVQGIYLITKLRKNRKNTLVRPVYGAVLLRKYAMCETIINQIKNIYQIGYFRHESPKNFLTNLFSLLIAYNFTEKKSCRKHVFVDTKQLLFF